MPLCLGDTGVTLGNRHRQQAQYARAFKTNNKHSHTHTRAGVSWAQQAVVCLWASASTHLCLALIVSVCLSLWVSLRVCPRASDTYIPQPVSLLELGSASHSDMASVCHPTGTAKCYSDPKPNWTGTFDFLETPEMGQTEVLTVSSSVSPALALHSFLSTQG